MARQSGLIKINGTLDNVNFYKTKDGDLTWNNAIFFSARDVPVDLLLL
jgi:hypothetical protein